MKNKNATYFLFAAYLLFFFIGIEVVFSQPKVEINNPKKVILGDDQHWNNIFTVANGINGNVSAIAVNGNDVYVGGNFSTAGGVTVNYIAKWNGNSWSALGSGLDNEVYAIAISGNDVYVAGKFTNAGGVNANNIAKWNGSTWSALGTGTDDWAYSIAVDGTNIYVGGIFNNAGSVSAKKIARWNGTTWSALGGGANSTVRAIAINGTDVYIGGDFDNAGGVTNTQNVAKWNGTTWSPLGNGLNAFVNAICVNGTDILIGGNFTSAGGITEASYLAKWNGNAWSALGSGVNNTTYSIVSNGSVVYVCGTFSIAGGTLLNRIAKWDGSSWSALGQGLGGYGSIMAINGSDLYVGGSFMQAGGKTSYHFGHWNPNVIFGTTFFTISGKITFNSNPLPGVTIKLTGDSIASVITNATGDYSFSVRTNAAYLVTPQHNNYAFDPGSNSFSNISSNQTANFTAYSNIPSLASPLNNSTGISINPTLTWNFPHDVYKYRLQVSTNSSFLTTMIDDSTISTSAKSISGLLNNSTYYWRICVQNQYRLWSDWTSVWSFTTAASGPNSPVLLSPANSSTGLSTNPTLSWNAVSEATTYRLQVSTDILFPFTILDDSTITTTSKTLSGLSNDWIYYWRVKAKNASAWSDWSGTWSFRTAGLPAKPVLSTPAFGATGVSINPILVWNTVTGATNYHLRLGTTAFATTIFEDSVLSSTTKIINSLSSNTVYVWKVRAKNEGGWSEWSETWNFTTIVSADIIKNLTEHIGWVNSVTYTTDGTLLASGSSDYTIKIWNASEGSLIRTLTGGQSGDVWSVAFSPDGTKLASGSGLNTDSWVAKIWNVSDGSLLRTLTGFNGWVMSVSFSPDGSMLATGCADYKIKLWNVNDGSLIRTLTGHTSGVNSISFSPDDTKLTSGSDDGSIIIWDVNAGSVIRTFNSNTSAIYSVNFSPDGSKIASGGGDNAIKIWNANDGSLARTLTGHSDIVRSVVFSRGGTKIASGSNDNTIKIWNVNDGILVKNLTGHTGGVKSVAFPDNVTKLASGSFDRTVKIWATGVADAPSISSPTKTNINSISAILGANITYDGGATILERGVVWSTSENPTLISYSGKATASGSTGSFTINATGLNPGNIYHFRGYATNNAGTNYTYDVTFSTLGSVPVTPTLSSPSNNSASVLTNPALSWNSQTDALVFRLQVSTSSSFSSTIFDDSSLTVNSKIIGGLSNNTSYFWRVRAKNAMGWSDWSNAWTFTTIALPNVPSLLSPVNNSTGISINPILSWNTVTEVTIYRLQVSSNSTFTTIVIDDSTLTTTTKSISGLNNSSLYYWRIRAKNAGGWSDWSSVWSFTTLVTAPNIPILSSPSNSSTGVSIGPTLSWNTVSGTTMYRLQISTNSTFATTIFDDSTITSITKSISGLNNNTLYYWRVKAGNSGVWSDWSTAWIFTTIVIAPNVPILSSPSNNSTGVSISPLLSWNTAMGATTYRLQVSTNSTFAATTYDDSTITSITKSISGLNNNTLYYWRIKAGNSGVWSDWSSTWSFTTILTAPVIPVLVSPTNNSIGISINPIFIWNTITNAVAYRLQVSTDSLFSLNLIFDSTIPDTLKSISGLNSNTIYYWRVKAGNSGVWSDWSNKWTFTTNAAPNIPLLLSPQNNALAVSINPSLSWNSVSGANIYCLQVSIDSMFITKIFDDSTLTTTTKVISNLNNNTVYYWRLKAGNFGLWSNWSSEWRFTTIATVPSSPVLLLPAINSTGVSINPSLSWNSSTDVTRYRLQVSIDSTFTTSIFDDSTLTTTTKVISNLNNNTVYYWRLKAGNSGGWSNWSGVWNFTTIMPVPTIPVLLLPANNSAGISLNPSLNWSALIGVSKYRLQMSADSTFTSPLIDDSVLTTNSKSVTGLNNNTVYFWRVRAGNSGGWSVWSSTWSFTTIISTPNVPVLVSPSNNAGSVSINPSLNWNAVTGASKYRVQVSTNNLFTTMIVDDSSLTSVTKSVSGLINNAVYYWRVKAGNSSGWSDWTSIWNFITIVAAPNIPVLVSPLNNSDGISLNTTLSWNITAGASVYHLQVSTVSTFATTIYNDNTLTSLTKSLSGLTNNTIYYWRVKAGNSGVWSDWSNAWRFTTLLATPAIPVLLSPINNSTGVSLNPELSWNTETGATSYYLQISTVSSFSTMIYDDNTLTSTTKLISGLNNGTTYYWRVKVGNSGIWSDWSNMWSFTTISAVSNIPVLASPLNNSAGLPTNPILNWNSVTEATTYHLQASTLPTFSTTVYDDNTITSLTKSVTGLSNNTLYYWRVRAMNSGGWSEWSNIWSFTTVDPNKINGLGGPINTIAVKGNEVYFGGRTLNLQKGLYNFFILNGIAKWNGVNFAPIVDAVSGNEGVDGEVKKILVDQNGNLYVGGDFKHAGGLRVNGIAKLNGNYWSSLGSGFNVGIKGGDAIVTSIAIIGNDIFIAGSFATAGGVTVNNIAKWDGSTFSPLTGNGTGVNGPVYALAAIGNTLWVGGKFTLAGGASANNIATWNGSTWSTFGSPPNNGINGNVYAIAGTENGVYVGGNFYKAGTVDAKSIVRWDGTYWTSIISNGANGVNLDQATLGTIYALSPNGKEIFVGGSFWNAGTVKTRGIAKLEGNNWSNMSANLSGEGVVNALATSGNNLYVGGNFKADGTPPANYITSWDRNNWYVFLSSLYTINGTITGPGASYFDVLVNSPGSTPYYAYYATPSTCNISLNSEYSFITAGGSYTVTPVKTNYFFKPSSQTFTNITNDQALNFIASTTPEVKVQSVSNIKSNSASFGVKINYDGGSAITGTGVIWSIISNPTLGSYTGSATSSVTSGSYTIDVLGLNPNTIYHYRAYAVNTYGTSYTDDATMRTDIANRNISNLWYPNNNSTDMTLSPTLSWVPATNAVKYHLQMSTDSSYSIMIINDSSLTASSKAIKDLQNNTAYYWRVRQKISTNWTDWSSTWNFATIYKSMTFTGHTDNILSNIFSPNGTIIASAGKDNTIRIWNANDGTMIRTISGHSSWVNSLAFSPDGTKLISGGYNDNLVKLWNLSDGSLLKTYSNVDGKGPIAFSSDGTKIFSTSYFFDLNNDSEREYFDNGLNITPGGTKIACSKGNITLLWNTGNHSLLRSVTGTGLACFSSDGNKMAIGVDNLIRIYNVNDGALLQTLVGHSSGISSIVFSTDGIKLASGSYDETIKIWNTFDGSLLRTITSYDGYVSSLSFSPDGNKIVSNGSKSKTIKVWLINAQVNQDTKLFPDLTILSGNFTPSIIKPSEKVKIGVKIKNQGILDASESNLDCYLYENLNNDGKKYWLGRLENIPVISAGSHIDQELNITLPVNLEFPVGSYFVGLVTDPENKIAESDENNNSLKIIGSQLIIKLPDPVKPSPVAIFSAKTISNSQINLSWEYTSIDFDGFIIERKEGTSGTFNQLSPLGKTIRIFEDKDLQSNSSYFYRIFTQRQNIKSDESPVINAITIFSKPVKPGNFKVSTVTFNEIKLEWEYFGNDHDGFQIERKNVKSGVTTKLDPLKPEIRSFNDKGLEQNVSYLYSLTAYNSAGNSDPVTASTITSITSFDADITVTKNNIAVEGATIEVDRNDGNGFIKENQSTKLNGELRISGLKIGSQIRALKLLRTKPAVRPYHEAVDNTMYELWIDSDDWIMDGTIIQYTPYKINEIKTNYGLSLSHPVIKYNLTVHVYNNVNADFLNKLVIGFKAASNILYCVTDGQAMFNKVAIYDNGISDPAKFKSADVWVQPSAWPNAHINGMYYYSEKNPLRIELGETWGDPPDNGSDGWIYYCTIPHEFGHYGFAFFDEYFTAGLNPFDWQNYRIAHPDKYPVNYGLMDFQYAEIIGQEISSNNDYMENLFSTGSFDENTTTMQVLVNNKPCWEFLKEKIERENPGISLLIPSMTKSGSILQGYYNNGSKNFQDRFGPYEYPVSNVFISNNTPDLNVFESNIKIVNENKTISSADIFRFKGNSIDYLGKSSQDGSINVKGLQPGDILEVKKVIGKNILSGKLILENQESGVKRNVLTMFKNRINIKTNSVSSKDTLPPGVIFDITPAPGASQSEIILNLKIKFDEPLYKKPEAQYKIGSVYGEIILNKENIVESYNAAVKVNITDSLYNGSGYFKVLVYDTSGNANNFVIQFILSNVQSNNYTLLTQENFELFIKKENITADQTCLTSTLVTIPYSAPGQNLFMVGKMFSIRLSSNDNFSKGSNLNISLTEAELSGFDKNSLGLYNWSEEKNQWVEIKSSSLFGVKNLISAIIYNTGIYSIFAKGFSTDNIKPGKINNLTAQTGKKAGEVILTFTSPGDDGYLGTASKYLVKYYASTIDDITWDSASTFYSTISPKPAGNIEIINLILPEKYRQYYFAFKTIDKAGNISEISNCASAVSASGIQDPDVTIIKIIKMIPSEYSVSQNSPNPFNPSTTIQFSIPKRSPVSLEIYNILGQRIRILIANEIYNPGVWNINWDGRNDQGTLTSSGVYFYRLRTPDYIKILKMIMLR